MKSLSSCGIRLLSAAGLLITIPACDRSPSAPAPAGQEAFAALSIGGPSTIEPGGVASFVASARNSFGPRDVTNDAHWNVSTDFFDALHFGGGRFCGVTFDAPGRARAFTCVGEAEITASIAGLTATHRVLIVPPGTFKLSGVVSESGGPPLEGVPVEVVAGTGEGLRAITRREGRFSLYGVAGQVKVRATLEGFTPAVREIVVSHNDATEAFTLTPIATSDDVSGHWTLVVEPAPGCRPGLPNEARGRPYQVQIVQWGTRLSLTVTGPTLRVLNPGSIHGTALGSRVHISIAGDTSYGEWSSANIYDHFSPTERFGFSGLVNGTLIGGEIRALMYGDMDYWRDTGAPRDEPNWYCRANDHVVTLRRQEN